MASVLTPRQPFGELGQAQLQQLTNTKNRQNAITEALLKNCQPMGKVNSPPSKRTFEMVTNDDVENSENVDPALFTPKRSKGVDSVPMKPKFTLTRTARTSLPLSSPFDFSLPATSVTPSASVHDDSKRSFANAAPLTAPAGRSPKHKRHGILSKKRHSFTPFKRIDPPAFGLPKSTTSEIPFSLDAALSGTLTSHVPKLKAAIPKGWVFDIHEDTPEEEAANLMEHSTCILDISDDESSPYKSNERGKENIPPLDHPAAPPSPLAEKAASARRAALSDAMVDEGEVRLPLGDLRAVDFYDVGLDATSNVLVPVDGDKTSAETQPADVPAQRTVVETPEVA